VRILAHLIKGRRLNMPDDLDPIVGNWYSHLDKGQRFEVVAIDGESATVETQDFDGNVNEYSLDDWYQLDIEVSEEPENWSGAMDIGERDDYGTEITDTTDEEFDESLDEIHDDKR
jgi:hypothetical protein